MYNLKSYAKINLYLHLITKQSNYHLIDSLFSYVALHDLISIQTCAANKHKISANYILNLEDNLMYKIIVEFLALYKIKDFFHIIHQKNIPISAGMGGGSANAAIILNFLYDYYNINVNLTEKINFAKKFGADIAFFLTNYSRYISGIGDNLGDIVTYPEIPILIINPFSKLSTSEVFKAVKLKEPVSKIISHPKKFNNKDELIKFLDNKQNDLTDIALAKDKKLSNIYNYIDQTKYFLRLTGSGSSCFIIAREANNINNLYVELKKKFADYLIIKSNILAKI